MSHYSRPVPMKGPYLTPGVWLLIAGAAVGLTALAGRFLFGLGAVSNLSDAYPWGIWTPTIKAGGVALAAGGFTTAALCHVIHREEFHPIVRPALLMALLGYTFVALSVCIDIGRWYFIWHPIFMWNGSSALFEVGICVTVYLTVLYIEFLPVVCERFIGRVDLPGALARLNRPLDRLLRTLDGALDRTMFVFIILGVVLSTLHQSSLGTLMVIAGPKMHPLWQTPILPLMFLLSAISVGLPMAVIESLLSARAFGYKPRMDLLSELGRLTAPLLAISLAFKIGDMMIRETFVHLTTLNAQSLLFMAEIAVGIVLPLRMLASPAVRRSPGLLGTACALVAFGVLLNRMDTFLVAYTPAVAAKPYFPAFGEVAVAVGFVCLQVLIYRAAVMFFPVISLPDRSLAPRERWAVGVRP
ncbi:MAG: Ni/Fe-hydrogenase cytochrome b subunit [Elusimicrobia bacterium]|nr:Ni/Fe-hydrogenase cytochrome b subunit [Elusimicrobiota bacterium]